MKFFLWKKNLIVVEKSAVEKQRSIEKVTILDKFSEEVEKVEMT